MENLTDKVQSGLKKLYVPLGVMLGVGIALSWYYFGWVASQQDYFRKRDFRQLATLSGQVRQKVDNFDHVMDHVLDQFSQPQPPWTPQRKADYLKSICADLEYQDETDLPDEVRKRRQPQDPPSL